MSDSLENVGTFNRIRWPEGSHDEESCHWIGKAVEWYFDFGQKSYNVLTEQCDDGIPTQQHEAKRGVGRTILKVIECTLKIFSFLTVVIPVIMLFAKCVYRAENIFVIKPNSSDDSDDSEIDVSRIISSMSLDRELLTPPVSVNESLISTLPDDGLPGSSGNLSPPRTELPAQDPSNTNQSTQVLVKKSARELQRDLAINHVKHLVNETLSDETLNAILEKLDEQVDNLAVNSFSDLERVRILYHQVNDQISKIGGVMGEYVGKLGETKNQQLFYQSEKFYTLLNKLKVKFNEDPHIPQIVKELETLAKQEPNEKNLSDYIKAVGVLRELTTIEENNEPYDVKFHQQAKLRITPTPIANCGNSCYMNSDLQMLLSVPLIKEMLLGEWKQIPTRARTEFETVEEYNVLLANELKVFNETKEQLKHVKTRFEEFCTAQATKKQADINKAARNLRDAMWDAGLIEDTQNGRYEQMQAETFVNRLLNAAGYALRSRRRTYGGVEGKEELYVCDEEYSETMITLGIKDGKYEEPYSQTIQGLVNHHFSPQDLPENSREVGGIIAEKDVTKLLEAPEQMFIHIKRFGFEGDYPLMHKYKLSDPIAFDTGEVVDFGIAMDKSLTDEDQGPYLYEVVGMVEHHGNINGGHYTSTVKKGDEWYHCNDASRVKNHGKSNPNIEKGYLYVFKRIPNAEHVDG
jgi:ubiquitin C-terminal hydrolase